MSSCQKERKLHKISCLCFYFPLTNIYSILSINKEHFLLLHAGDAFIILSHPDVSSIWYWKYSHCLEERAGTNISSNSFSNFGSDPTVHQYFFHTFTPKYVMKMPSWNFIKDGSDHRLLGMFKKYISRYSIQPLRKHFISNIVCIRQSLVLSSSFYKVEGSKSSASCGTVK